MISEYRVSASTWCDAPPYSFCYCNSMSFFALHNRPRVFRPALAVPGSAPSRLREFARYSLGPGNLSRAVQLPEGEDVDEWLAVNVVDFYNHANMLYATVAEVCGPETCPIMNAGPRYDIPSSSAHPSYEYYYQDNNKYKKPTKLPASEYIENLLRYIQIIVDDDRIFPSKPGVSFPPTFLSIVKTMCRRMSRVYSHIYCAHFAVITALGLEPHLNTSFKHFFLFCREFKLVEMKEFEPLQELVDGILESDE
ncbi:Maintenance of ploidy protein mob1 [Neolecta irregularis DAH-3]|uniref:Maintenance of ploidy protein mob1 n=1 Tax=Neolecta irregularis (strain DAH-3) TaxID=1198029 RepID=A0A1U7LQN8_NEOID|nr:Maintenance of ploidy protein mob1 [Neolecta irregularis DAH-3]|eukprot:OLL24986.1 Maintenance of ploidy protein mob1 [Neolecta irregularis DAH-3]